MFNWTIIGVAAIVPTIIGYIWYGPLMGKQWIASTGKSEQWYQEQGNMPMIMAVSLVMSFMFSFGLDAIIQTSHGNHYMAECSSIMGTHNTFGHGAFHGLVFTAFFVIPFFVINGMFERRGPKNYWIHIIYWLICGTIMGGLLDMLR